MNKPKVAIIFTGGTISMSVDPRIGAAIPSLSNEQILALVTNIDRYAEIETIDFSNIPGPHMDPDMMMKLRELVIQNLDRADICGVIITHGTDTLEETAYLLDLSIDSTKPIVMVGAMRNSSELGYDGPSNLAAAVCTAISPQSHNKGTLVVMNNDVNAASEVTKTNTLSLDTFKSLEFGALGIVDGDDVIFHRKVVNRQHIITEKIDTNVELIKCVAGMDSNLINHCVNSGVSGLVIEGLGRGNVPPKMLSGIKNAIDKGIAVVLISRCPTGRVMHNYGYEGGGNDLRKMGVIFGGDLPGQKARIKLMLALGKTKDLHTVRELIENYQYR
ncbi:asparaginase [Serpentinicella alkaliphila]|uniref:asparaginase n=1 Tax=Serpentinicella alkaliphila TaxID=1734049 RepID=A0A4R2TLM6_9FIRM|nr:asparaginase [Serpentinicella alkaliphila]QUH26004.1 asparaginase [Serpentinicella alkaliphila]TCQ02135.1 L-asparaginase [Serpentinicella alkaliphila]